MKRVLLAVAVVLMFGGLARGDLLVTLVDDALQGDQIGNGVDYYYVVVSPGCWEAWINKATGGIFAFYDLTDVGVQGPLPGEADPPLPYHVGDHVNYTGTTTDGREYAYGQNDTLFLYAGNGGSIFRLSAVTGLADRLTFEYVGGTANGDDEGADASKFIIRYEEDGASTDYVWNADLDGVARAELWIEAADIDSITAGDVIFSSLWGSVRTKTVTFTGDEDAQGVVDAIMAVCQSSGGCYIQAAVVGGDVRIYSQIDMTDAEYIRALPQGGMVFPTKDAQTGGNPATEDYGLTNGLASDIQTDVVMTLNEATGAGTVFDIDVQAYIVAAPERGTIDGYMFYNNGGAHMYILNDPIDADHGFAHGIDADNDNESTGSNDPFPLSYGRHLITDTPQNQALGLTVGREFILDVVGGYDATFDRNQAWSFSSFGPWQYERWRGPWHSGDDLADVTKHDELKLLINIAVVGVGDTDESASKATADLVVAADGADTADIEVQLKTAGGQAISGAAAAITVASDGTGDTIPHPLVEDAGEPGTYATTLSTTTAELKTLTVTVDTGSGTVTLDAHPQITAYDPGTTDAGQSVVAVSADEVPADDTTTAMITIELKDLGGLPVTGKEGNIQISAGDATVGTVSETGTPGTYEATIKSGTADLETVIVTVDGSITLDDQPEVNFYSAEAKLVYSGQNLPDYPGSSSNPYVMTIQCVLVSDPDVVLWELDLTRQYYNYYIMWTRFDDKTDAGDFNYATLAGWGNGLFALGDRTNLDTSTYTEVHKDEYYFQYTIEETDGGGARNFKVVNTYTVYPSSGRGTIFHGKRELINTSAGTIDMPYDMMDAYMKLGVGPYKGLEYDPGTNPLGDCYLSDYDVDDYERHHMQSIPEPDEPAVWTMTDNLDEDENPGFNPAGTCWAQGEVKDNAATAGLGMVPGRTFLFDTDVVGYRGPANQVGDIVLDFGGSFPTTEDGIRCQLASRSWYGSSSAEHDAVDIAPAGSVTKNFTITINIDDSVPVAGPPDKAKSTVEVDPDTLYANGVETTTITITLIDANNRPVTDAEADLDVDVSGFDNIPGSLSEVADGVYEMTLASTNAEGKIITVTYDPGGADVELDDKPQVTFQNEGDASASVSGVAAAGAMFLKANGVEAATITITLRNAAGALIDGQLSLLQVAAGDADVSALTETSNGVYECTVTSTSPGLKDVVVTWNGTVILDDQPQLAFYTVTTKLLYSGDDLRLYPGGNPAYVKTITCVTDDEDETPLWTMDIQRQYYNYQVMIEKFDDLTDGGAFNYSAPADWGDGMFTCHSDPFIQGTPESCNYTELHDDVDYFEYSLSWDYGDYTVTTVYRINTTTNLNTLVEATRTVHNDTGAPISVPSTVSTGVGLMRAWMGLNPKPYDLGGGGDLSAYDVDDGERHHLQAPAGADAIYTIIDNLDRGDNPGFDPDDLLCGEAVVKDNSVTTDDLGLVPGRSFTFLTDIVGHWANDEVGNVSLRGSSDASLDLRNDSEKWYGSSSAEHDAATIPGSGDVSKNFAMIINISHAGAPPAVLEIAAEVTAGEEWVYQNTETTTDDRHISTVTITLVSEATPGEVYDISISDDGPDGANFTLGDVTDNRSIDDTLVVEIVGGRVDASTIGAGGEATAYNVTITVEGQDSEESDSAQVQVSLLRIGDINRDGSLTGTDRQLFNQRLNNVATVYTDRTFDLDGSGGAPTGTDKQVMNQALNNVPLP